MYDRLQTQLLGSYFSSFLPHSYGYEAVNEPKSALKLLDFRFGPYSQPGSWVNHSTSTSRIPAGCQAGAMTRATLSCPRILPNVRAAVP